MQLSLINGPGQEGGARETARPQGPAPAVDWGLRPYQCEAFDAIHDEWFKHERKSTLLVMATGLGKTQEFCAIAGAEVDRGGRVLIVAHRTELIDQAAFRARDMVGCLVGIEQANRSADNERIVVGSVQTIGVSELRRKRFDSDPFTLIIIDEAHHAIAESYRALLDQWPNARILGVTATPDRGDGLAMGQIFESTAYVRDIKTGIADGYLSPMLMRQWVLDEVDLSAVKTTAGDLNLGQVDEEMVKANANVAQTCLKLCGDRLTIVFSTKVETAHDLAGRFNKEAGAAVARAVDGKTPPEERRAILRAHARRDFQFLINVGIATEGYDCPDVSCVAIARPTKSRALYTQMAGRCLRTLAHVVHGIDSAEERRCAIALSDKPDAFLLDFTANSGRHDLACPIDLILDGKELTEEERAIMKETMKERTQAVSSKAEAYSVIKAERQRRAEAQSRYNARVKGRLVDRNPFAKAKDANQGIALPNGESPITPGQRSYLASFGVHDSKMPKSKKDAGILIGHLKERRERGLCTFKQSQLLRSHGIDYKTVTFDQAGEMIGYMESHGWQTPPPNVIRAIMEQVK